MSSEPAERQVPLLGRSGHPRPLEPARGEHVQVSVSQPRPGKKPRNQLRVGVRVLHHDPVELRNLAERICQAGELSFLHRSAVSGSDSINDRERCGVTPAAAGAAAAGPSRPDDLPLLLHISQPRQIEAGRVPNRQSLRVDVDHDYHYQDPRKKDEKASVEDGFHCA